MSLTFLCLRGLREQGEGSIGGDPVAFHQDPLGLPDDIPVDDRGAHLLGPQRVSESERGQGGEHRRDALVEVSEKQTGRPRTG